MVKHSFLLHLVEEIINTSNKNVRGAQYADYAHFSRLFSFDGQSTSLDGSARTARLSNQHNGRVTLKDLSQPRLHDFCVKKLACSALLLVYVNL